MLGANVAAVTRIGQYTPLHIAAESGSAAAVEVLLKAAPASRRSPPTPARRRSTWRRRRETAQAVKLLLDKGAEINARESEWSQRR